MIEAGPLGTLVLRLLATLNCFQNRLFVISVTSFLTLPYFSVLFLSYCSVFKLWNRLPGLIRKMSAVIYLPSRALSCPLGRSSLAKNSCCHCKDATLIWCCYMKGKTVTAVNKTALKTNVVRSIILIPRHSLQVVLLNSSIFVDFRDGN